MVNNLIKATRIQRAFTAISTIMVPVAFAGRISFDIIILCIVCLLVYAASGLLNARMDNDYKLPKNYKYYIYGILAIAFLLSCLNLIVLITFFVWLILGVVYNTTARKVLFADVTLLAISHHALPVYSAAWILNLNLKISLTLSGIMFITFWFIIHVKNLKDSVDDKKRGYLTVATRLSHGTATTKLLFELAFMCFFIVYFVLDLSQLYLKVLLVIFLAKSAIGYLIDINKHETALNYTRLMAMVFLLAIVIDRRGYSSIGIIATIITLVYSVFVITTRQPVVVSP